MARRCISKANIMITSGLDKMDTTQEQSGACGDPFGTWTSDDHATYLRLKQRCTNNNKTLVKIIQRVLPDKTEEEITEHDEWYKQYQALRTEQRAKVRRARSVQHESAKASARAAQTRDRQERAETKRRIEQWKQRKIDQKRAEEQERNKLLREIREREGYKVLNELTQRENGVSTSWKPQKKLGMQDQLLQKEIDHINNFHRSIEANMTLFDIASQGEKCAQRCRESSINRINRSHPAQRAPASNVLMNPQYIPHKQHEHRNPNSMLSRLPRPADVASRRPRLSLADTQCQRRDDIDIKDAEQQSRLPAIRNMSKLNTPS